MNERIAEIRKAAGMTQEEFAVKIGLSRNFIWMIEKGDRVPSDRTIRDICEKFGVRETWLRDGIGEPYLKREDDDDLKVIFDEIGVSDDEVVKAIVKNYWQLNDSDKAAVRKMVDKMVDKMADKMADKLIAE